MALQSIPQDQQSLGGGPSTQWNQAWNIGYNNSGPSTNPYAGQVVGGYDYGAGYTQGQQQYLADKAKQTTPQSPGGVLGAATVNTGGDSAQSAQDQYMASLDSAYQDAISSLNPLMQGQQTTATNSFNQANTNLGTTQAESQAGLDTQGRKIGEGQTNALTSLADNLRNQYQAGNVYLGARGAGDSSASGMYAYALGRAGTKARGDVLGQTRQLQSDLGDRQASLDRLVTSEKGKIQSEYTQNLQNVSNWYNQMISQLQTAKATDKVAMSKDILDRALGAITTAQTNATNMGQALTQWAMNNATSLGQLTSNLNGLTSANVPQQAYNLNAGINPMGTGSTTNYTQGSYFPTQEKKLYS